MSSTGKKGPTTARLPFKKCAGEGGYCSQREGKKKEGGATPLFLFVPFSRHVKTKANTPKKVVAVSHRTHSPHSKSANLQLAKKGMQKVWPCVILVVVAFNVARMWEEWTDSP